MSCVLYKDGETLLCDPADMAREMAAGWSVTDPSKEEIEDTADEVIDEEASEETNEDPIEDSEEPETGEEPDEESSKRKKILGIL
tara:strand:+ start:764 stop:1018 length:255 start_codon:yes stop_codon:yes gene_type:complete